MYFALSVLHIGERAYWLMPFGQLADLYTCHLQMLESLSGNGVQAGAAGIDQVIPDGI
ncbi:MAG: hypothetical protein ACRCZU_05060 [Selenomonadaceae bacterium]